MFSEVVTQCNNAWQNQAASILRCCYFLKVASSDLIKWALTKLISCSLSLYSIISKFKHPKGKQLNPIEVLCVINAKKYLATNRLVLPAIVSFCLN